MVVIHRCRDAIPAPGVCSPLAARQRVMARRTARSIRLGDTPVSGRAGTFRRAMAAVDTAPGRAFRCRRESDASSGPKSLATFRNDAAGRSASSWQGLIVVPGGAPAPPECLIANQTRERRASSRLTERLAKRPLSGRDGGSISEFWGAGITTGLSRNSTNGAPDFESGRLRVRAVPGAPI